MIETIKDIFSDPEFSAYVQRRYIAPAGIVASLLMLAIGIVGKFGA